MINHTRNLDLALENAILREAMQYFGLNVEAILTHGFGKDADYVAQRKAFGANNSVAQLAEYDAEKTK